MKRITWTIGVQKAQGNIICDGCLHYNEPKILSLDGQLLQKDVNYYFSPDYDGTTYSDTCGFLDFTPLGGLFNTMKLTCIW